MNNEDIKKSNLTATNFPAALVPQPGMVFKFAPEQHLKWERDLVERLMRECVRGRGEIQVNFADELYVFHLPVELNDLLLSGVTHPDPIEEVWICARGKE